jgi:carbamate kinase
MPAGENPFATKTNKGQEPMNDIAAKQVILVALGGNALIRKGQAGNVSEQFENLKLPIRQIAALSLDNRIIITHGNGPQVGHLLLQQECCDKVFKLPLEILVAQTQGQIGYMIESTLDSALMELDIHSEKLFVSLLSYVVVDENDPALQHPTKPIGPVYEEGKLAGLPFPVIKTAKGYRRVVASPKPITIVEKREIQRLIEMGFIVICCGGGGIPVVRDGRAFSGVDAVIDKDLASARLAQEVGVDLFVIATDVPGAAIGYGTDHERFLDRVTVRDAERLLAEGQFPPGSMGPKIQAATEFIKAVGKRAVITGIDAIEAAVQGKAGTEVVKGD